MSSFPPTTDANLQALSDALDAYQRSGFQPNRDPSAHLRSYNFLFEAAGVAGYSFRDDHRSAAIWATERLSAWRAATGADPLADLREALKQYDRSVRGRRMADFDKAGGYAPIGNPAGDAADAARQLYTVAVAHGFDATCQLPVEDWAHDRLNGMYAREAA